MQEENFAEICIYCLNLSILPGYKYMSTVYRKKKEHLSGNP